MRRRSSFSSRPAAARGHVSFTVWDGVPVRDMVIQDLYRPGLFGWKDGRITDLRNDGAFLAH